MSFEFAIALRYLKTRRHGLFALMTTIIAIGGVTLGVASLIVTLAVMSGFREDIQRKTLGIQPHIVLFGTEKDSQITVDSLAEKTKMIKGVEAVSPFVLGQTLFKSNRTSQGVILRGIEPEKEFDVTQVKQTLILGDWESLKSSKESEQSLILGKELAKTLSVSVGDELIVFSPTESASLGVMGNIPKLERFKVSGIFQSGMYEYDANMALTSLSSAQNLFGITGVTGLGIRSTDLDQADKIAHKIADTLDTRYWLRSWQSMNKNLFEALKLEKIVMTIILTMIILVASFTIISNLLLMSIEKTRDIGILRAIGSSQKSIRKIFLYAGMTLGITGIFLGTGLGIAIVYILERTQWIKLPQDVYYIDTLPVQLSGSDISIVLVSALLITVISSVYPASQASKVNPAEAIRYG